ncbi:filamentous hemagglutinin N-terminal domain-containing protein [Yersinia thracica]|uniref:two-partner secretion domain-containing protein n=1 Tax=Yersinia thracica TaxID=2890319 RepID=UPI001F2FCB9C|nr:filamentous hemagglutinin N-terminal domain-containing protein [Yersinia thracica]
MIFVNENNRRKLSALPLSIMLSLCGMSVSHAANIIADEAAPAGQQADIKIEPNSSLQVPCRSIMGCGETTTINIQTPDTNGLSHNKYTKFDVPHFQDVVVLNNNLIKEINGNPNLENTTAKIILNEVRSSHASQLAGSIRLSGQDAHVIIANPLGIDCNGCSFSDMSHLTLTTGEAYFSNNKKLQGFNVVGGGININNGMLNRQGLIHKGKDKDPAYLDLFSNSLKIKGKVQADDLFVIAGKNNVRVASPGEKMGISPLVAYLSTPDYLDSVDVRQMGGMYANKIRIIAEGNINNSKKIESTGALQMVAGGNINNSLGGAITGGEILLYSGGLVHNLEGKIKSSSTNKRSSVYIKAAELNNNYGKIQTDGGSINIVLDSPIKNNNGDIAVVGKTKTKRLVI